MIYYLFVIFHIFMVKLSVYGKELHPTELGDTSLILSVSRKMSLILRFLIKYIEKLNFWEKSIFDVFRKRWRGGVWDIFVEWIKLYHNLKVRNNCMFIYQDTDLEMKTPEGNGKKLSLILTTSYFLSLILTIQPIFVPNSDGSYFLFLILTVTVFIPNYDFSVIFCP